MRAEWADFYEGMADRLGQLNGMQLYKQMRSIASKEAYLGYMHFDNDELWQKRGRKLDPFTIMGAFNRGQTDAHRYEIAKSLAFYFNLDLQPPQCFHGIPYIDPRHSVFEGDSEMWTLYKNCLNGPMAEGFAAAFDAASQQPGNALGNLSIALFWIRPYKFMAIDRISRPYISDVCNLQAPGDKCSGAEYADFLDKLSAALKAKALTYPELTFAAWQEAHHGESYGAPD